MSIKERYNNLITKTLTPNDFHDIMQLKNDCKLEMNFEYLFMCDLLIVDSYIEGQLFNEALKIAIQTLELIEPIVFRKIYVSFLDRIIYLCIQKKNYKSAYRYAFDKRNFIDLENIDQVNRWYLEMAYIYAELGQTEKALIQLKAIIANYPEEDMRSLALSNMTKIYIDQKQIQEAKQHLNECMTLVNKLNDEEGILYCDYLNAKIYLLENEYDKSKKIFEEIFALNKTLEKGMQGIGIEYLSLLYEMGDAKKALDFITKYEQVYNKQEDLELKKQFNQYVLKVHLLGKPTLNTLLVPYFQEIEQLDRDIAESKQFLYDEMSEEDKILEVNDRLKTTIQKIERAIHLLRLALLNEEQRDSFMEFSKKLQDVVPFDEALYLIYHRNQFDVLPEFMDRSNQVDTFEFKKDRLYERTFPFSSLNNTIFETILRVKSEFIIDFTDTTLNLKDPVTERTYLNRGIESLVAIPLYYEKEIFAAAVFTSKSKKLLSTDAVLLLKIACRLLEFKMIGSFYQEYLSSQKNILQIAINGLQEGMFYLEPTKKRMILTDQLSKFLGVHTRSYTLDEFRKRVHPQDAQMVAKLSQDIQQGEEYDIRYRMIVQNQEYTVREQAFPFISKDGQIKFYVGTIHHLETSETETQHQEATVLNEDDFLIRCTEWEDQSADLSFKFSLVKIQITNLTSYQRSLERKSLVLDYVHQTLTNLFQSDVFIMDDESFISYTTIIDQRKLEKIAESALKNIEQGVAFQERTLVIDAKCAYVRYPRDAHQVKELSHLLNIALESNNRIQSVTEEMQKRYIQSISISKCVEEHIQSQKVELFIDPLSTTKEEKYFELRPNVRGIQDKDIVGSFLSGPVVVPFEFLVLQQFLEKIKSANDVFYILPMHTETLQRLLLDQNLIKKLHAHAKQCIILIYQYDEKVIKLFHHLKELGIRLLIEYSVWKQLRFEQLLDLSIFGVHINEAIESVERNQVLTFFDKLSYVVLANYDYPDYDNLLIRNKKPIRIEDLHDENSNT